jgi:IPT/TIG domain-containing protein
LASSIKEDFMQLWQPSIYFIGLMSLLFLSVPVSRADEQSDKGSVVEGAGFSLFEMESIKGFDEKKIEGDPICDRSKRPKIHKVEPDEAKPGQKVTIKGENFGTKECFHGVAFSAAGPTKVEYKFVNDTTIEATVPDVKAGMSFIDVVAGGGNARSKGFLVQAK